MPFLAIRKANAPAARNAPLSAPMSPLKYENLCDDYLKQCEGLKFFKERFLAENARRY